jgi:hypothetical protein
MWWFAQKTGRITKDGGALLCKGYSGADEGKNNPAMQSVHDKGPIPVGLYTMEAPVDTHDHGPFVIRLVPDEKNEMFGRAGFLIHGDSIEHPGTASKGCIIAPRYARERLWDTGDHQLRVVVSDIEQSK